MFEVGRWCVKTAGRDGGLQCIVVEKLDNGYVTIDGQTRRKKCNVLHLEPLDKISQIESGASHSEIVELFKDQGIVLEKVTSKPKTQKPVQKRESVKKKVQEQQPVKAKKKKVKEAPQVKEEK